MVQVIVNSRFSWSEDEKQTLASRLTEVIKEVTGADGEVSVWFQRFGGEDVYVGAEVGDGDS